jgi:hypothetical protein
MTNDNSAPSLAMGLTIHFDLSLAAETPESEARAALAAVREAALDMPFQIVTDLVRVTRDDIEAFAMEEASNHIELDKLVGIMAENLAGDLVRVRQGIEIVDDVYPHIELPDDLTITAIAFAAMPGEGCEPVIFALAKVDADDFSAPWSWHGFCKTQYASAEGDEHFLKCHRSVIELLDAAQRIGIQCEVTDEGGFYETRDVAQLLAEVDKMNRLIAHFAGRLSDMFEERLGDSQAVEAEIFHHPDFERLETRGLGPLDFG